MYNALVTGGGGYLGTKLCKNLLHLGYRVTAYDVHFVEKEDAEPEIERIKGDLKIEEDVLNAVRRSQADVVFHLASYGMSGREMLQQKQIEAVNVKGTSNLIKACKECGVKAIVYTSTYNVVFGGQEIRNGNESMPYLPMDKFVDHYSKTKTIAERMVLSANGTTSSFPADVAKDHGRLRTCALRCAGIYGEGERRHLPRIVSYTERGLFLFVYGTGSLADFLHADNFVQAHIKVAETLLGEDPVTAGKAYFISDGEPVNSLAFFRPLVEGLGYSFPTLHLPVSVVYFLAYLTELIHGLVGKHVYDFQPFLTRAEVYKSGVTHYFSIEAAKRDFNYSPDKKDLSGCIQWFKERGHGRKLGRKSRSFCPSLLVAALVLVVMWILLISLLPTAY